MAEIHEDDHSVDTTGEFSEPEGGWISAPQLVDTELLVTTLCRFTGRQVLHTELCPDRLAALHVDIDCRAFYVQAEALAEGRVDLAGFGPMLPEEVRLPFVGGEPSGTTHE